MSIGYIHSMESMGLVDGPGIRTVVFFQGCALRCQFCHNPDTWEFKTGDNVTPEELVSKIRRFKPYFKDTGGVTFSGGDPLMQPEFLIEVLKLCKEEGIHTCIDTAGCGVGHYDEILKYTDLVLFDIKGITPEDFQIMTTQPMTETLKFMEAMKKHKTKIWIRHVVIPNLTDSSAHMEALKNYISTIPNVEKVELLPYHLLGVNKYQVMNIPYPLDGTTAMDKETVDKMQRLYFNGGNETC
ncbi:MAG: pyruvate formate-lyase-activating protein [Anaerostipes sp.]